MYPQEEWVSNTESLLFGNQKVTSLVKLFGKQISSNDFYSKQSTIVPWICNIAPFKHRLCNEK